MKAMICGAGIAGLTLAWWLERDGWGVRLVEQAPGPREGGYMIDFVGSGYDVAELMGLLPQLRSAQTAIQMVNYVDPRGRARGRLEYGSLAAAFDDRLFTFMHGDLERALRASIVDRVAIQYGTTIDTVESTPDAVAVSLSDGTVAEADLLIGADGIHSRVRGLVFGPERPLLRYLGYHTASYTFVDDDLLARVGKQFLIVAVPGRQVGLYPTNDGRLAAWLVHRAPDPTLPSDPAAALRHTYQDMGDLVGLTLRHCPPTGPGLYYDQVAQIEMDGWTQDRVTLIGDACQAVSLMAGQGASMAVGGAYVLADELRRGEPATAAGRYERRIRPFIRDKQKAGRRTAQWLVPSSNWRITARAGAFAVARLPGLSVLMRPTFASMRASVVPPGVRS